jgi:hypothetical protein
VLPDVLYKDLPRRIREHALPFLADDEHIVECSTAKRAWGAMPAILLPASAYLALTDKRLLCFNPSRLGNRPAGLAFEASRETVTAEGTSPGRMVLVTSQPKNRKLLLSTVFPAESTLIWQSLQAPR